MTQVHPWSKGVARHTARKKRSGRTVLAKVADPDKYADYIIRDVERSEAREYGNRTGYIIDEEFDKWGL